MSDQVPAMETPAEVIPHVGEQQYIAVCEQDGCGRKARGTIPQLGEHGWVMLPPEQAGQMERRTPVFFCPACVLGLKAVP